MTTSNTKQTNDTQTTDQPKAIVCVCCLTLFPVIYLIGSTVMNFLG